MKHKVFMALLGMSLDFYIYMLTWLSAKLLGLFQEMHLPCDNV